MKWTINARVVLVAVILTALIVNRVLAHFNIVRLSDDLRQVAHTHQVLDLTSDVLTAIVDAETGQRGFLITGADEFLEPYRAALAHVDECLRLLEDETQGNPRQQQRIATLADLIDARLTRLKTGIELRRQDAEQAFAWVASRQGKKQMDAIRELVMEVKDEENALLAARERNSLSTHRFAVLANSLTALLASAVVITCGVWINRNLVARQKSAEAIQRAHHDLQEEMRERSRIEQALRESERIYRAIGESIDYGVWLCDAEGKNTYASQSFLQLVGLTQEQCSEFGWGAVLHPDDAERTIAAWKECVRTGDKWDFEHRFHGRDGHWHPILARGVPVADEQGRLLCWAGINLDISRMKRAELALQQAYDELEQRIEERTAELTNLNERLQREVREHSIAEGRLRERVEEIEALMEILPMPVWIAHDPHCHKITGNRATYEVLQLRPGTNLSLTPLPDELPANFRASLNGRDLPPHELPLQRATATGTAVSGMEFNLLLADGSMRHVYANAVPLFDNAGNVRGGIASTIDITEKQALQELDRRRQQDRLSSLATLAAGIAHEINNPVGTILLAAEMALASDEHVRQALSNIVADAKRCGDIVRNVLRFANGEPAEKWWEDLNDVVHAACDAVNDYVRSRGCSIDVALVAGLPRLKINSSGIQQVLENLLRNAADASAAGNLIEVRTEVPGRQVRIVVRDQGSGIADDALRRVCEPFYTTRRSRGGTGLGLSIAQTIVNDHNGTMRFESIPGRGTTVTLELPAEDDG